MRGREGERERGEVRWTLILRWSNVDEEKDTPCKLQAPLPPKPVCTWGERVRRFVCNIYANDLKNRWIFLFYYYWKEKIYARGTHLSEGPYATITFMTSTSIKNPTIWMTSWNRKITYKFSKQEDPTRKRRPSAATARDRNRNLRGELVPSRLRPLLRLTAAVRLQPSSSTQTAAAAAAARRDEGFREDAQGIQLPDRSGTHRQGTRRLRSRSVAMVLVAGCIGGAASLDLAAC